MESVVMLQLIAARARKNHQSGGGSGDPQYSKVVSLLYCNGTVGSKTVVDQTGRVWNALGGTSQISNTQALFGGTSMMLGAGLSAASTASPPPSVGTQDFTYEAFIYRPSGTQFQIYNPSFSGNNFFINTSDIIQFSDASIWRYSTNTVPGNAWSHIAVSRTAGVAYIFINGVIGYSGSMTTSLPSPPLQLSAFASAVYVGEFRITVGYGRYTAAFTPPAQQWPNHT